MKRKRHTPEEIIKKLREAAPLQAVGGDPDGRVIHEVLQVIDVPTLSRGLGF